MNIGHNKFKNIYFWALTVVILNIFSLPLFADSDDWLYRARIGGYAVYKDVSDIEIFEQLSKFKAQHVSVVEGDSDLSLYLTPAQFDSEMVFIARVTKLAHSLDLKLVWYYPSLEVLTVDGEFPEVPSMFKDHSDWVQYNIDDSYENMAQMTPNVFYGSLVFWVEPNEESAWMCHLSPYRDYFFDRLKKLAATGVDGVWIDVPLFNDIVGDWCCSNPYCRQKFENDTGMIFPTKADLNIAAPNFRRWMVWRHTELNQFLIDIKDKTREINPDFETIIEIVTCDYNAATHQGLDGTYLGEVDGLTFCWEIDALSDDNAMRDSNVDDWYNLIAINKFCRGASGFNRPSWAFTYGLEADDGELVMAESIAAQINPYDTKIPLMTTIISPEYRARMFSFIEQYQDPIFKSKPMAKMAIIYSNTSRDFSDYEEGTALYTTTAPPVAGQKWWAADAGDGLLGTNYLADYRGWVKILTANHIPFDVIPVQHLTTRHLDDYEALILPNPISLSQEKGILLADFIGRNKKLFITGSEPFSLNEYGIITNNPISDKLLDVNMFHFNEFIGKKYIQNKAAAENDVQLVISLFPEAAKLISTNASPTIHFELYKYDQDYILHCVNFNAVNGQFSPSPETFTVSVQLPDADAIKDVTVASPDQNYNFGNIEFTANQNNRISFTTSVSLYSIVIISFNASYQPYSTVDLPSNFDLENNYPNPFSNSTTITVKLNIEGEIKLEIYNILGQSVIILADCHYPANTYNFVWDGRDSFGQLVADGIYIYHLKSDLDEKIIKTSFISRK